MNNKHLCLDCGKEIYKKNNRCQKCFGKYISPKVKGDKNPFFGKTHSIEFRKKLSESMKGEIGRNTGKKHSEESKKRMSLARQGKIPWNKGLEKNKNPLFGRKRSEETKKKIGESKKGKHYPKISERMRGEKSRFWKGGITPINELIRHSLEYRIWRKSVFERDRWTCIWCGYKGSNIEADHIKRFSEFPELRFAIDNGRTLCRKCHMTTKTWGNS